MSKRNWTIDLSLLHACSRL